MLLYLTKLYKLVLNYVIKNYIMPLGVIPLIKKNDHMLVRIHVSHQPP